MQTVRGYVVGVGIVVVAVVAVLLFVLLSDQNASQVSDSSRLTVGATIFPLADIVRHVAGDDVGVVLIIPPGVSEHSHDFSPQQVQDLQNAQVIFQIGNGLDDQLTQQVARTIPGIQVADVDAGIVLREFGEEAHEHEHEEETEEAGHADTGIDPHYWLTVPNAVQIATNVAQTLSAIDPEHTDNYQNNLSNYSEELMALERELQAGAAAASTKEFIAMHSAWSYFAEHYGFELVATYEPVEGSEPSVSDIQRLQDIVRDHGIQSFYAEPQKHSFAALQFIEQDLGLTISTLDPVGGIAPRDSYINLMRENIKELTAP